MHARGRRVGGTHAAGVWAARTHGREADGSYERLSGAARP
jgi:hypothetical protein